MIVEQTTCKCDKDHQAAQLFYGYHGFMQFIGECPFHLDIRVNQIFSINTTVFNINFDLQSDVCSEIDRRNFPYRYAENTNWRIMQALIIYQTEPTKEGPKIFKCGHPPPSSVYISGYKAFIGIDKKCEHNNVTFIMAYQSMNKLSPQTRTRLVKPLDRSEVDGVLYTTNHVMLEERRNICKIFCCREHAHSYVVCFDIPDLECLYGH